MNQSRTNLEYCATKIKHFYSVLTLQPVDAVEENNSLSLSKCQNCVNAVYGHGVEFLVFILPAYANANHQGLKG